MSEPEYQTLDVCTEHLGVIDKNLKALNRQLGWIVVAGVVSVVVLLVVGVLYVQDIRSSRKASVNVACTAVERLAVANERFIRDIAGPGVVTDERLAIYHLYVDPAIEDCRESALQGVLRVPVASRPKP